MQTKTKQAMGIVNAESNEANDTILIREDKRVTIQASVTKGQMTLTRKFEHVSYTYVASDHIDEAIKDGEAGVVPAYYDEVIKAVERYQESSNRKDLGADLLKAGCYKYSSGHTREENACIVVQKGKQVLEMTEAEAEEQGMFPSALRYIKVYI